MHRSLQAVVDDNDVDLSCVLERLRIMSEVPHVHCASYLPQKGSMT